MQQIKDRLKGMGMADSTIKTYTSILNHFFNHIKKATGITEQEITNYLDYLIIVKNYQARSRNLVMKIIKFYCREFLNFEPELKKAKENKPIPKVCWDDEYSAILSVTHNPKHRLCLHLMRYSGLRNWEVIRVMRHHILSDGRLFIKAGKGQKDRYTIIPKQVSEVLDPYLELLPKQNQYIFQSQDGTGHYCKRTPLQILENAFVKLGWHRSRWFGCHALRHAFTIWAIDIVRLDYDEVSKMLGHSVRQTTQIYTQCRKLNLQRAINQCREVQIEV